MNGGKSPIKEGDYLLLELNGADNAGSNNGKIIAIERQDISGDDQYLLRKVEKKSAGQYQLNALNPSYDPMIATADMATFARFMQVVDISDILLHREFYKHEVAELFGLEYQEGVWKMPGHVSPKASDDQFLFVTLNKQGADKDYRYHDYFVDESHFHWQSQNRTTPENQKGLAIIENHKRPGSVYLFVRKFNKIKGKGAPFTFCGRLNYLSHVGSAPMDVDFELESALTPELSGFFTR